MKPDEFIELLEERPFIPLRLHMSNGRVHEVRHPENAIVGENVVALGVPQPNSEFPRIRLVSLPHINEVEQLLDEPNKRKRNGRKSGK
jgi:hypothetical protein